MKALFNDNSWKGRLIRTILQGVIGVIIANLDLLAGYVMIPAELRPFVVALVMAILSPIMAALGGENADTNNQIFGE